MICSAAFGLSTGAVHLSLKELLNAVNSLLFSPEGAQSTDAIILAGRFWRVLGCICIGGSLAMCGAVLQRLLRNPLADPFVLGISAGGTTAVISTLVVLGIPLNSELLGIKTQFLASCVGCLSAFLFVLVCKKMMNSQKSDVSLPLIGLVLNSFFGSILMIIVSIADPLRAAEAHRWMLGSVGFISPLQVGVLFVVLFLAGGVLLSMRSSIDALAFGHDFARSVGVSADRAERVSLFAASMLVASVVAVAGSIGFIGLIVPHISRTIYSNNQKIEWPVCVVLGSILMVIADTISRTVVQQVEMPVGVFTAALGAPVLIFFMFKRVRIRGEAHE